VVEHLGERRQRRALEVEVIRSSGALDGVSGQPLPLVHVAARSDHLRPDPAPSDLGDDVVE
jgi:hypothetical protein